MLSKDEILQLLSQFNINQCREYECFDSSHGDNDIRKNYIIDKKYVLRLNSAKVMDDHRIADLNRLIDRYHHFGLQAPLFIKNNNGTFVVEYQGYACYLSEYLDAQVAYDVLENNRNELISQRVIMVAKFAKQYKGIDLIETKSMYSLFDLCPYDQINGIDEKQTNCNNLVNDLTSVGEIELANKLNQVNEDIRKELLAFYNTLPRCVFQGDENFSNLCVNDHYQIIGLFDFNMAGTDMIVNYLANIAFQGNYYYEEDIFENCSAIDIFEMVNHSYQENTELIKQYYQFTKQELYAYKLISKIVILFGYWNQVIYSEYVKGNKYKEKTIELLKLLIEHHF